MADSQTTRYAKLVSGTPRYSGDAIPTATGFIVRPTEAQLRANGWLPVVDEMPDWDVQEGYHWERRGWAVVDGEIVRQYEEVKDPTPQPRVFSKLKIVAALTNAGVWPQVKQFIIDADLYDLYLAAQEFAEDNEYFIRGKQALQTAIGWTDAQVETILEASVV